MQKQTFAAVFICRSNFWVRISRNNQCASAGRLRLEGSDLQNLRGQEAIFYASDWPSGFRLPWHVHQEGHEFVYVIEGEQTFEIEGVGTKVVKAGEMIYTPPNTPHYGRNATDKFSKTLVVRIKAKDQPVMTEVKHN